MNQISPREWERLSAYLDQQLSEKERIRLESRLKGSPELKKALEELRRTRLILRSQPRLKAPRNFTLTAEMVAGHQASARPKAVARPREVGRQAGGFSLFPALRFASALASVLLVLVVLGDLLSGAPLIPSTLSSAPAEVAMQKSAPAEEPAAEAESFSSEAFMAPTEQGALTEQGAATEEAAVMMAAGAYPAPQGTPEVVMGGRAAAPTGTPAPMPTNVPPMLAAGSAQSTPGPQTTALALMEDSQAADSAEAPSAALQAPSAQDAQPVGELVGSPERLVSHSTLRILEISLAIVALATGLLAIYSRRLNQ